MPKTNKKPIEKKTSDKKPARMSKLGLERLYLIDRQIASGKFPNTKFLAEYIIDNWGRPCSTATVSRDIDFMRDRFRAPIEYDPLNRGYYYTQKTYRLPAGFTSAEDLLALGMARSILSLYRDTPLYEASSQIMESIIAPIALDGNRDWLDKRIVVPKVASAKVDPEIWKITVSGLKENRIITFDYLGTWDEDYKKRKVRPYQLLFDSGVWFLYGFSEERKAIRMFSLSRMKNPVLTREPFVLPKNFDYNESNSDSYFGVFVGEEKKQFEIECYDEAVTFAAERQWANDQKITEIDGGVCIKFSSSQYHKVLKWVLSCGCNAVPVKPKSLVDDWKWHVQEMRKLA